MSVSGSEPSRPSMRGAAAALSDREVVRYAVILVLTLFVFIAPALAVMDWYHHRDIVALREHGRTVTIEDLNDVRSQIECRKQRCDIVHVWVRLDGEWTLLKGASENQPDSVGGWWPSEGGMAQGQGGNYFAPPLPVRWVPDTHLAMTQARYERDASAAFPDPLVWSLAALAIPGAGWLVVLVRRAWRDANTRVSAHDAFASAHPAWPAKGSHTDGAARE